MKTPVSLEIKKLLIEKDIDMPVSPTIAEVVMWLYEKHGIWTVVSTTISKQFIYKCIDMSGKKDPSKSNYPTCVSKDGTYYNSPTEAYLQAIKYTLKNLI